MYGTKVKANASRHKGMSYGHMLKGEAELKAQIEALLGKARAADEAERNEPELGIPAEIARRQDRLDAIAAARARLEQRQRVSDLERGRSHDDDQKPRGPDGRPKGGRYKRPFGVPEDKEQENFTDPHSRIMPRSGGGFDPGYNAQMAVDADRTDLIVALGEGKKHADINAVSLPQTAAMATQHDKSMSAEHHKARQIDRGVIRLGRRDRLAVMPDPRSPAPPARRRCAKVARRAWGAYPAAGEVPRRWRRTGRTGPYFPRLR